MNKKEEPKKNIEAEAVEQPQKPVSEVIAELVKGYEGDLKKVQDYVLGTFTGHDLYTAGFQICLYAVNDRLRVEQEQRRIFKEWLDGAVSLPFDPRDKPFLSALLEAVYPVARSAREAPRVHQVEQKKPIEQRKNEMMSRVHEFIDAQGESNE